MKSRKGPKLPRYLMNKVEDATPVSEPKTAADFYDLGVMEEESGDRWFSSDLAKSLRFYHRAHDYYKRSLQLDGGLLDSLFNLPRLEFDVYNKYIKNDSVVLQEFENCDDVFRDASPNRLLKDLISICKSFETCFEVASKSPSTDTNAIGWDFYYNLALVYFEYIESSCNDLANVNQILHNANSEVLMALERCAMWFQRIFDYFETMDGQENDKFDSTSVVQVLCDAYNLVSTVNESMYSLELLAATSPYTEPLLVRIDTLSNLIIPNLEDSECVAQLELSKLNESSSSIFDFQALHQLWNQNASIEISVEKRLLEGSSYRSFLDKMESRPEIITDSLKWEILSYMSSFYKELYEILKSDVTELEKSRKYSGDELSSKISLLCTITIERGDIELERSLLNIEVSVNNRNTLQGNAKNILKNAIIFSKKSGGLKESVSGKLSRAKRQREAVMRLCIIDGKTQEEWDTILGAQYWPLELEGLKDIDVYSTLLSV